MDTCEFHIFDMCFDDIAEGDDYDDDDGDEEKGGEKTKDSQLMPPPSWIPPGMTDGKPPSPPPSDAPEAAPSGDSPDKKLNTPLAAMLPPGLADKDVRSWFPEFRPGMVECLYTHFNRACH